MFFKYLLQILNDNNKEINLKMIKKMIHKKKIINDFPSKISISIIGDRYIVGS